LYLSKRAKALKKDNDFVYNEKIVATENLPEVKGVSLVKALPIDFENDKDVAMQDIFVRLVSMKAHELSSVYSEEKAKLLREVTASVDEKNVQLEQFLSAMHLDQLNLTTNIFENYLKLPKQLLECCAALTLRGQLVKVDIPLTMRKIVNGSLETKASIDEIEQLIEQDYKDYKAYRASSKADGDEAGSDDDSALSDSDDSEPELSGNVNRRRKQPPSARRTKLKELLNRYDSLSKSYNNSTESNKQLHEAFSRAVKNLELLALPLNELSERLPSVDQGFLENEPQSQQVREKLLFLVGKIEEMKTQRAQFLNRLKLSIQDDDVTKTIASRQNDVQTNEAVFFQNELKKHEELRTYLEQNMSAQDNILRALAQSNADYISERNRMQDATRDRDQFVQELIVSYQSINEMMEKANEV
jgi:tyrosine-protein phosphatase non-receptor type 23